MIDYDKVSHRGFAHYSEPETGRKGGKMLIGACGITCEVCGLLENEACEMCGCVPGTDVRVPDKQRRLKAQMGFICEVLECAAKKKIDFCFKCREFPCEIYYSQGEYGEGFPFSKEFLDKFK